MARPPTAVPHMDASPTNRQDGKTQEFLSVFVTGVIRRVRGVHPVRVPSRLSKACPKVIATVSRRRPTSEETMSWTVERIELLKTLWEQGVSASEIAETLGDGLSRNAVIGKAHRLLLSGCPSPISRRNAPKGPSLLVLTEKMCRWPLGDPQKPGLHFCGRAVEVSVTYCPEHRAVAFQKARKLVEA